MPGTMQRLRRTLFQSPAPPTPYTRLGEEEQPAPLPAQTPRTRQQRLGTTRESITVALRVRPLNKEEESIGEKSCIELDRNDVIIRAPQSALASRVPGMETEARHHFDRVHDSSVTQSMLFKSEALPLVQSFLSGHNALLFCHGSTNAGKTYTVEGKPSDPGLLPRVLDVTFNSISQGRLNKRRDSERVPFLEEDEARVHDPTVLEVERNTLFTVYCCYSEIYNERIFDLLEPPSEDKARQQGLKLREDARGNIYVKELKEVQVTSLEDAHQVLLQGRANRRQADTLIHQHSSRSHAIFTIKLLQTPVDSSGRPDLSDRARILYSKLSVVDLAGSERIMKTQTTGMRLRETTKINGSLMTLGRCMDTIRWNQQHENGTAKLVPFRESKLTRLLQGYFMSKGRITMVVNVNPCSLDYEETSHVLKFGAVSKGISVATKSRIDSRPPTARKTRKGAEAKEYLSIEDEDEEDEVMGEFVSVEDHQVELDALRHRLEDAESQVMKVESDVRAEVAAEMAERLQEMEKSYHARLAEETSRADARWERKVAMASRGLDSGSIASLASSFDLERKCESLTEERDQLQKEREKAMAEIQKERDAVKKTQAELLALKGQLKHQEEDSTTAMLRSSALEAETDDLRNEVAKLRSMTSEIDNLKGELQRQQQRYAARLSADRTEARRQAIDEVQADLRNSSAEATRFRCERDELQIQVNELSRRVDEMVSLDAFNRAHAGEMAKPNPILSARRAKEKDGSAVLHQQEQAAMSPATANRIVLPKDSKVISTPTKEDLQGRGKKLKFKKYEVLDVRPSPSGGGGGLAMLWRGNVARSVTGDGVSVSFTDVETLQQASAQEFLEKDDRKPTKRTSRVMDTPAEQQQCRRSTRISKKQKAAQPPVDDLGFSNICAQPPATPAEVALEEAAPARAVRPRGKAALRKSEADGGATWAARGQRFAKTVLQPVSPMPADAKQMESEAPSTMSPQVLDVLRNLKKPQPVTDENDEGQSKKKSRKLFRPRLPSDAFPGDDDVTRPLTRAVAASGIQFPPPTTPVARRLRRKNTGV